MIQLLIKKFINNYEDIENKKVREAYGTLSGIVGILCNMFLFVLKLIIGLTVNSIAIISDAFNNLTDIGSSAIAIISAKVSNTPPDENHPMGHGRIEYISSLIVSFIIILVGFQLLKTSIGKIIRPEELKFDPILMVILGISVLIKVWMYSYNKYIANKINSSVNKATAYDSISDVFSTLAVIGATILGNFLPINIDGFIGCLVSILILYTGYSIAKETINLLLGLSPDPELIRKIQDIVESGDYIVGTHDLQVHDYGPGRRLASIHAEVPDTVDIAEAHASIDDIEEEIEDKLDIKIVVHMDPILTDVDRVLELKKDFVKKLKKINPEYKIRSFRVTSAKKRTNIIFDLVVPQDIAVGEYPKVMREIVETMNNDNHNYSIIVNTIISVNEKQMNIL